MKNNNIIGSILGLTLALSGCTSWINQHKYQKFEQLSHQFTNPQNITQDHEQSIVDGFQSVHEQLDQLSRKTSFNQVESIFYTNIANLHAAYAEYLSQQNCPVLSQIQSDQAEQAYLKLLQLDQYDLDNIYYNLAIFYARQSTFERDDPDSKLSINYLKKAQRYATIIYNKDSSVPKNWQVYYDVLSELQVKFSQENIEVAQQLDIAKILQKPLNEYLESSEEVHDGGNFIVLVQHHYQDLYQQDPRKAQNFLNQNKETIFKLYFDHLSQIPQRNLNFHAKLYALYNQPEKALSYLKQLKFDTTETIKPEEFEKNKIFDPIRRNTAFKQWLSQYTQNYLNDQKQRPKQCKSIQKALEQKALDTVTNQMNSQKTIEIKRELQINSQVSHSENIK